MRKLAESMTNKNSINCITPERKKDSYVRFVKAF